MLLTHPVTLCRPQARFVRVHVFNPNDPATWADRDAAQQPEEEPLSAEAVQMLSDSQLLQLLESAAPIVAAAAPRTGLGAAAATPDTAAAFCAAGVARFKAGEAQAALELFQRGLVAPGSGALRERSKPRDLSSGEQQALWYNASCAHCKLGEVKDAAQTLLQAISAGFDDKGRLEGDADLALLRLSPYWVSILAELPEKQAGFLGWLRGR